MPQETFSAWDYTRLLKEPMPESRSPEAPAFRQGSSHKPYQQSTGWRRPAFLCRLRATEPARRLGMANASSRLAPADYREKMLNENKIGACPASGHQPCDQIHHQIAHPCRAFFPNAG